MQEHGNTGCRIVFPDYDFCQSIGTYDQLERGFPTLIGRTVNMYGICLPMFVIGSRTARFKTRLVRRVLIPQKNYLLYTYMLPR